MLIGVLYKLAILGGGQMGEALLGGLIDAKWASPAEIVVAEIHEGRREQLAQRYGVRVTDDGAEAARQSETVLLAVKPQDMEAVLDSISRVVTEEHLVISIAAGIPIAHIEERLADRVAVVRIMPNSPALVREGVAALAAGSHANPRHVSHAEEILSKVGRTVRLPEKHLDAVTGLSGTGPAYVFFLAEMLIEAGVGVGLPRDVAAELTVQTLLGAARMLRETGKHPVELREMVTSPGGTTAAAMRVLERAGVRSAFLDAVRAATERSRELAAGNSGQR
ncbi:MAG: pyrroline-5-carboxylate reductase [Acidobacteria bacterium]|nr:pyrroline-5-carboxylate reductase [Acidobacteriota bacterium]